LAEFFPKTNLSWSWQQWLAQCLFYMHIICVAQPELQIM
jgi:hypothetical protein